MATEFTAELSALEKRVKLLQHVVYIPEMGKEVSRILAQLPHPDPNHKPAKDAPKPTTPIPTFESLGRKEKIKILLLRARTNLLLPVFSSEAEADLNRALKLDQTSAEPLILLSECLWRKNALKEACEAIESALRIKPGAAAALCQQSRLLRSLVSSETDKAATGSEGSVTSSNGSYTTPANVATGVTDSAAYLSGFGSPAAAIAAAALAKDGSGSEANSTPTLPPSRPPGFDVMSIEERKMLTEKTIEKAREAVKADPMGSEAWQALGMALLFDNITNGMDMPNLKKALGAFNQAIKNNGTEITKLQEKHAEAAKTDAFVRMIQLNPDNFYNRAVVLECFAQYGAAASDYETAARLDPTGLRAGIAKAKSCVDIVRRFKTLTNDCVVDAEDATQQLITISATTTKVKDVSKKLGSALISKKGVAAAAAANATESPEEGKFPSGPCLLADVLDKHMPTDATDETSNKSRATVTLLVVDSLTSPTAQPLVYLCCDQNRNACALLIYRVNAQAIFKGDVISVGFPPSSAYTLTQTIPGAKGSSLQVRMPIVCVEPDMVTVNGAPIPSKAFTSTRLSTRLFQ